MTSLREDIVSASAAFERDSERADAAVAAALAAMEDADTQRSRAVALHLRGLDSTVSAHEGRLGDLEGEFAREVRVLEGEFAVERQLLVTRHAAFQAELQHTLEAVREEEEARVAEELADFDQAREALRRRALERLNALQSDMDSRVEAAEGAFEEAHHAYITATARRTGEFKALMQRTEADALLSERQQRAMGRMARLLQVWRSRLLNASRDARERNDSLHGESSAMARQVENMKGDIGANRRAHMARLKALSAAAAVVKGRLAAALATGEKLFAAAEAARVHESLGEKVDPFALAREGEGSSSSSSSSSSQGTGALLAAGGTLGAQLLAEGRAEGQDGDMLAAAAKAAAVEEFSGLVGVLSGGGSGGGAGSSGRSSARSSAVGGSARPNGVAAAAGAAAAGAAAAATAALAATLQLPPELLAPHTAAAVQEGARLAPFYGRLNKALLEGLVLARRRDRLRAEHSELSGALAQVLDGLALAPGALDGINSLVVVNGRAAVDAGAGTALAPSRAAVTASFLATGAPVRLGGGPTVVVPVRPGAPGVASVAIEGNAVYAMSRKGGGR